MPDSSHTQPAEQPDWLPFPYPQLPAGPPPQFVPPPRGATPSSVQIAVRLMVARIVLAVVSLAVLYASRDELRAAIIARYAGFQVTGVDRAVSSTLTTTALSTVIFALIYSRLATRIAQGNRRARTRTMVLAGLAILAVGVVVFGRPMPAATKFLAGVDACVDAAIIICLAGASSTEYFARNRI